MIRIASLLLGVDGGVRAWHSSYGMSTMLLSSEPYVLLVEHS